MNRMSEVGNGPASEQQTAANMRQMVKMVMGFGVTQIVSSVAALSIADELAKGPATAAEIASHCATDPDATLRLLRACVSLDLVVADNQLRFAPTPLLDTLRRDTPGSLRGLAISQGAPGHWLPFGRLVDAITTGSRQTLNTLGKEIWEYYKDNWDEGAEFSAAMSGMTATVSQEAAAVLDTRSFEVAADIGGSGGALVHAFMEANPLLRGILFDLPEVVAPASTAPLWQGMRDRFSAVGGDFLTSVPEADLYLLKYILHDWDSPSCIRILDNCRRSLRPGGRIVVIEQHLGEIDDPGRGAIIDVHMLVMLPGHMSGSRVLEMAAGQHVR